MFMITIRRAASAAPQRFQSRDGARFVCIRTARRTGRVWCMYEPPGERGAFGVYTSRQENGARLVYIRTARRTGHVWCMYEPPGERGAFGVCMNRQENGARLVYIRTARRTGRVWCIYDFQETGRIWCIYEPLGRAALTNTWAYTHDQRGERCEPSATRRLTRRARYCSVAMDQSDAGSV
eukprot:1188974-Prorocentrum_minimum.AAC.1